MKKLFSMLMITCLLLSLCACQASNQGDPAGTGSGEKRDGEEPHVMSEVPFLAQNIRTNGGREGVEFPSTVIIRSVAELKTYVEENRACFDLERKNKVYTDTTVGFLDACDRYDEAFFEKQILVMILMEEGSGSIRDEVTDVSRSEDGKLYVTIETQAPEVGTCDMAQWHILIEIEKIYDVESEADVILGGRQLRQTHTLTVEGGTHLLLEPLQDTYDSGETVTVRLSVITDTDIHVYLNGEPLEYKTNIASNHWEISFAMPYRDSTLTIETAGDSSEPYFNLRYEVPELGFASPWLCLSERYGIFFCGYPEISAIQMGGNYQWSDGKLILYANPYEDPANKYVFSVEGNDLIYLAEESDETELFFDGMIFSQVEHPFYSNSGTTTTEPPDLKLVVDSGSMYAIKGGYDWTVHNGDGTSASTIADSMSLQQLLAAGAVDTFHVTESWGTLAFEVDPDAVAVRRWSADGWGDPPAYENIKLDGFDMALESGGHFYEVEAKWVNEDYEGTVRYYFLVLCEEKTTQETTSNPSYDSSTDATEGGPDEILFEVTTMDGFMRYLTAAESEALRDVLHSLSYSADVVCLCEAEFRVDNGYGEQYGISLSEGYVRCELGQAVLSREDQKILADLLN